MTTRTQYVLARVNSKCQRRTPGCLNNASGGTELVMNGEFLRRMTRDTNYADSWCVTCTNCELGTNEGS